MIVIKPDPDALPTHPMSQPSISTSMTLLEQFLAQHAPPVIGPSTRTLLEQIETSDGPPMVRDADRWEIAEELRRLYMLTETLSYEKPAAVITDQKRCKDKYPDGFLKLKSNAVPFDVVTPEEIRRRIEGAEHLSTSNMATNLRKSKLKNGGEIMRSRLAEHGLRFNLNEMRYEAGTRVIALVEGEVLHLAADLQKICIEEYPVREIAKEVIKEAGHDRELMEALSDTNSFLECMSALEDAFKAVDPPLSGVVPKPSKNQTLNRSTEKFSCATHGLGVATQRIWANEMKRIGEETAAVFAKKKVKKEPR